MATPLAAAAPLTEAQLQSAVLSLCRVLGILAYHTHDSRRSQPGFPDLVLTGRRRTLFRELKTATGRVTPAQQEWGRALGASTRPKSITATLTASSGAGQLMAELVITVQGTPAPQGSKSRDRFGNMFESSKLVKPWRDAVAAAVWQARANQRLAGPLTVSATFYVPRPKSHYGTGRNAGILRGDAPLLPASKPDTDKYARGLLDALQIAGVFGDDGQVTDLNCRKRYAEIGVLPGALVRVEQVTW